jgi:hypothetical protein
MEEREDHVFTITARQKDGSHLIASSHPLTDQDIQKVFLGLGKVTSIKPEPSTIGYAYKVRYTPWERNTRTPVRRSSGAT